MDILQTIFIQQIEITILVAFLFYMLGRLSVGTKK